MGRLFNGTSRLYMEGLLQVGAVPILLATLPQLIEDYAVQIDAGLFTGGVDLHPRIYGEHPRSGLGVTDDERDDFEVGLYHALRRQGKPVFGICRGIQLINVSEGGTLHQHLPSVPEVWIDHTQRANPPAIGHEIELIPESVLGRLYGSKALVNSYHHQAVNRLASTMGVVALSPDGLIEAVEGNNTIAVQWHPELMLPAHPSALYTFQAFMSLLQ
ncbi:gamma-glutamyl-gamma-aminobutyrate hydrolase family protein [Deinococcus rubellus]